MIRYSSVVQDSIVDGEGFRVVAFLQGCSVGCKGCHNPELKPFVGGKVLSDHKFVDLLMSQLTPAHRGVTLSGGHPLEQIRGVTRVCRLLKERGVNIWLYTGWQWEYVRGMKVFEYVDVVVDGPFVIAQRDKSLPFRGSTNQRIIDVKTGSELELEGKAYWAIQR